LGGFLARLFGGDKGFDVEELARRLGLSPEELQAIQPAYRVFTVPKRGGGSRRIAAPAPELKQLQRRILKRLLSRLKAHPSATGFQRGHSIVTNARVHARKPVVVRMDMSDFFGSTSAKRVEAYFRAVGWNGESARLLTRLSTHEDGLPQGAPTSPRLSNLVNVRLDARLSALAGKLGAVYTRYADDITFSFSADERAAVGGAIVTSKRILADEGYALHQKRKLHIRRRHQQQLVTGLVVNERPSLPRSTRRWLRAVEHHVAAGKAATLTAVQLAGWRALQSMITGKVS
jgi:retron-type reverse transcriptase